MGLPVLNFKFLPDRCHWGKSHLSLQWQEGAAGTRLDGPSLARATTCSFCLEGQGRGVGGQSSTVCKAPSLPSAQPHFLQKPGD